MIDPIRAETITNPILVGIWGEYDDPSYRENLREKIARLECEIRENSVDSQYLSEKIASAIALAQELINLYQGRCLLDISFL